MELTLKAPRTTCGPILRLLAIVVGLAVFAFGALGARADESSNPLDAVPDSTIEKLSPEAQRVVAQVHELMTRINADEPADPVMGVIGLTLLLVSVLLLFPETGIVIFLGLALLWLCQLIPECPLPAL